MIINENLSLETIVVQGTGSIVSDMGEEKVMLNIDNGKYYNLGATGGTIWSHIAEPITISQLIQKLMGEYEVDLAVCEEHVLSFLSHLLKEGLIKTGEGSHS